MRTASASVPPEFNPYREVIFVPMPSGMKMEKHRKGHKHGHGHKRKVSKAASDDEEEMTSEDEEEEMHADDEEEVAKEKHAKPKKKPARKAPPSEEEEMEAEEHPDDEEATPPKKPSAPPKKTVKPAETEDHEEEVKAETKKTKKAAEAAKEKHEEKEAKGEKHEEEGEVREAMQGPFKVVLRTEPEKLVVGEKAQLMVEIINTLGDDPAKEYEEPVVGATVNCVLSLPMKGAKQRFPMAPMDEPGVYGFPLVFVEAGEYVLRVAVNTPDAEAFKVEFKLMVAASKGEAEEEKKADEQESKTENEAKKAAPDAEGQNFAAAAAPPKPRRRPRRLFSASLTEKGMLELKWFAEDPPPKSVTFTLLDADGKKLHEEKLTPPPFSVTMEPPDGVVHLRATALYANGVKRIENIRFDQVKRRAEDAEQ